ncbi:MAG: hypothetical protein JWR21_43 [Herminiimonas sp.]|nr:hypothetical protein [Herminiimonas sp.]
MRRADGEDIKIAKAMQATFDDPQSDIEAPNKGHIVRYIAQQIKKCESELFVQKKPLADAARVSSTEIKKRRFQTSVSRRIRLGGITPKRRASDSEL